LLSSIHVLISKAPTRLNAAINSLIVLHRCALVLPPQCCRLASPPRPYHQPILLSRASPSSPFPFLHWFLRYELKPSSDYLKPKLAFNFFCCSSAHLVDPPASGHPHDSVLQTTSVVVGLD
jgi:hypothetical protein